MVGFGIASLNHTAHAFPVRTSQQRSLVPQALLPASMDEATLTALGEHAVDVARQNGATYADIRLGETQELSLGMTLLDPEPTLRVQGDRGYSLRVLVDGVWGYAPGVTLDRDRLAQAARDAVAHARHVAAASRGDGIRRIELAPAPPSVGAWNSHVDIDPMTVPLSAQIEVLGAWNASLERILGVDPGSGTTARWVVQTRVVVSTEGSRVVQRVTRAFPSVTVNRVGMPNFGDVSAGFEVMLAPKMDDRLTAFGNEVLHWQGYPPSMLDVGRYPVLLDGLSAVSYVKVLAESCEGDRLLGDEADASGSSFFTPDIINSAAPFVSPRVTLEVTPTERASTSLRWDDEGVLLERYPLIQAGRMAGYITTRDSANALARRVNGTAGSAAPVARGGLTVDELHHVPTTLAREVTLAPGTGTATLADLMKDVSEGLFLHWGSMAHADPTRSTTMGAGAMFHVKKGAVVGRVGGRILMMRTAKFWKEQLTAIGDASTMYASRVDASKGMPWHQVSQHITAPAILANNIDVATL